MKNESDFLNRITIDSEICHGKPTVKGSLIMVKTILELLTAGMTHQEILDDYPKLEDEDILACLTFRYKKCRFASFV